MKKIYLLLLLCCFINAEDKSIAELPDFTPLVSLRSAFSGHVLVVDSEQLNWKIKEFELEEKYKKQDFYGRLFKLGTVQFVRPDNPNICLGIDEDGFFKGKSCTEDLKSGKLETVFSIIPTTKGSVQIRSLVQKGDQCITQFDNPQVRGGRAFGITDCDFDRSFQIELRNLIFILPPILESTIIVP